MCDGARWEEETHEYEQKQQQSNADVSAALVAAGARPNAALIQPPVLTFEQKMQQYTPTTVLYYMPIIPRLKKLIAHPVFSHLFSYGDKHMDSGEDKMVTILI